MKAWRVHSPEKIKLDTLPSKLPGEGQVKIKVSHAAITGSGIDLYAGKIPAIYPATLGRHGAGIVTEAGPNVMHLSRGDRISFDPYAFKHITDNTAFNGFLSDFAILNASDVFILPENVKSEDALFAGHIALALSILEKLKIKKGEHIVITEASIVGFILAQVAIYYQAVPILIDSRADRLHLAEKLGVYYCINSVKDDVKGKVFGITAGTLSNCVAHFASDMQSLDSSLKLASNSGRVVVAGRSGVSMTGSYLEVIAKQLSVFGVSNSAKLMPNAINLLAQKAVKVAPLISATIPFEKAGEAIQDQFMYPLKHIMQVVVF